MKYLLEFNITHPGAEPQERLKAKLTLKIKPSKDKRLKNQGGIVINPNPNEPFTLGLLAESCDVEWENKSIYTTLYFKLDVRRNEEKGCLEITITTNKATTILMSIPRQVKN